VLAIFLLPEFLSAKTAQETINDTPCLFEYRYWHLDQRQSPVFVPPPQFTAEQCENAKLVNESIGALQAQENADAQRRNDVANARARAAAAKRAQAAKVARDEFQSRPGVRIGMTADDVVNRTNWGAPQSRNRTITAGGTREQWVYGPGQYLYFENGRLTAIQD